MQAATQNQVAVDNWVQQQIAAMQANKRDYPLFEKLRGKMSVLCANGVPLQEAYLRAALTDAEGREHEWRKQEAVKNARHASKAVTGAPAYGVTPNHDTNDYSRMSTREAVRAAIASQVGGV
jgi:hypothetical protein